MPKAKKVEAAPEDDVAPLEEAENELDEDEELDDDEDLDDDDDEGSPFKVEATAEGKASALRLIDLLVEKGGMALATKKPGPKLIEAIAKILEAPGSLSARASKLSDTIVDSEDVDDLFVDDDVLAEILKRW